MRITKLAIGTYKTIRNGAEHIALVVSGHVNGAEQAQALFSIVPWAVVGTVPRLGELRALLNGSSIEGVMGMSREECLMNLTPTVSEASVLAKLAESDRVEYDRVMVMRGPEYRARIAAMIQAELRRCAPWLPAELAVFTNYRPMTPMHPTVAEHYSVRRLQNDAIYAVKTSDAQPVTIGPFATLEETEKAALSHLRGSVAPVIARATKAAPGEVIYPATGPSAPAAHRQAGQVYGDFTDIESGALIARYPDVKDSQGVYEAGVKFVREYGDKYVIANATPAPVKPAPVQRAYTFDMRLAASITVTAASEEEGKRMMWNLLQCAQTNFGAWPDGSEATGEVSLQDLGDMELGLVDGDDEMQSCEVCSAQVAELIGAPCGAEVCRACFDNGAA